MENVTDALYIAFAVLAFVVALSVSIITFGQVRVAAEGLINARDKTVTYTYIEPSGSARTVTREDIIPTLYRAYKENYVVRFVGLGDLYNVRVTRKDESGKTIIEYKPTSTIDLEGQSIGTQEDANTFIAALLEGKIEGLDKVRFSGFQKSLSNPKLYDILEGKTFKEELGVYYQEDVIRDGESTAASGVDDVNKTKKRIITYTYPAT